MTVLYLNDGTGSFTESPEVFVSLAWGDINLADIDNDGDLDIINTGISIDYVNETHVYLNDGVGTFTEDTNQNLVALALSKIVFEDVDNDGNVDLLMTGDEDYYELVTALYMNDGTGAFTLATTNGQYAVIITAANGCMSLSDCTTITTAGLKNELAANWKVAPNPTSGKVTVSTDSVANTSIVVTSAMGQVVTELQMNETSLTVDLSAQPTGIYFIKIGTTEVVKIVKF